VATTSEWRSLDGLKTALTWLLVANMATTLFVIVAMLNRLGTLNDIEKFGLTFSTAGKDEDARDFALTALGVWGLVALATAIVFIVWFFRAAKNNESLGRLRPRLGPGWAIGGWFIPLAFLVIPVLIAQDLWRGSNPDIPRGDDRWRIAPRSALVGWWWACLLLSRVSLFIGNGKSTRLDVNDLQSSIKGGLFGQILTIAAAVLAILVVRAITDRQNACLKAQQEAWTSQYGGEVAPPA
jgi:hypothetical protein